MKLKPPKRIHRTTIYELLNDDPEIAGVYIVAYLGRIIYIGQTEDVTRRITTHYFSQSKFGNWLITNYSDWCNIRIDILEPEDTSNRDWYKQAEKACIKKFRPLLNYQHKPQMTTELRLNTANLSF